MVAHSEILGAHHQQAMLTMRDHGGLQSIWQRFLLLPVGQV